MAKCPCLACILCSLEPPPLPPCTYSQLPRLWSRAACACSKQVKSRKHMEQGCTQESGAWLRCFARPPPPGAARRLALEGTRAPQARRSPLHPPRKRGCCRPGGPARSGSSPEMSRVEGRRREDQSCRLNTASPPPSNSVNSSTPTRHDAVAAAQPRRREVGAPVEAQRGGAVAQVEVSHGVERQAPARRRFVSACVGRVPASLPVSKPSHSSALLLHSRCHPPAPLPQQVVSSQAQ